MTKGNLYLVPCTLGEVNISNCLPELNTKIILQLKHFIVENERTARRFLKTVDKSINIDELTFHILNKHTSEIDLISYLNVIENGESIGLISEAGCPAIADPGSEIVKIAHQKQIRVIPLVGPSSILLALMASGFNGQQFAFHGYLPIENLERTKKIKFLELESKQKNQSQLFIETPFRNQKLLEELVNTCNPFTNLCIACDITLETEFIVTKSIANWKKELPDINKRPTIFILFG